jgi:hypothetical protein
LIFKTYFGHDQTLINPGLTTWLINTLTKEGHMEQDGPKGAWDTYGA